MGERQVQPHEAGEHPSRFQHRHVCRHCLRPVGEAHRETCCPHEDEQPTDDGRTEDGA